MNRMTVHPPPPSLFPSGLPMATSTQTKRVTVLFPIQGRAHRPLRTLATPVGAGGGGNSVCVCVCGINTSSRNSDYTHKIRPYTRFMCLLSVPISRIDIHTHNYTHTYAHVRFIMRSCGVHLQNMYVVSYST